MSKDYKSIKYIREKLDGFDPCFIDCVVRGFNHIFQTKEPDGCLSNTSALYVCAKKYGYSPLICYGLCKIGNEEMYHAWLEIEKLVIDLAIYGNINFPGYGNLLARSQNIVLNTPFIGDYKDAENYHLEYGRFKFDAEWKDAAISQVEGKSVLEYINGAPNDGMWHLLRRYLDMPLITSDFRQEIESIISGDRIIAR